LIDLFDELVLIANALDTNQIPYALVGGLAYSVWVELRATEDIDLLILPEDWDRSRAVLAHLGYKEWALPMDFPNIRIRRLTKLVDRSALVLDFLLADGGLREGIEKRVQFHHKQRSFNVAPPNVIITLKEGRMSAKDRNDIEGLRKLIERKEP